MAVAVLKSEHEAAAGSLLREYTRALDEDRLEDWAALFVEDGLYKVLSRENRELGLPAPLVYYYSRNMMLDRVTALRDALTFEPVYTRHLTSGETFAAAADGEITARSTFALYQTTEEGETRLFSVGEYLDRLVWSGDVLRFKERIVVMDTFSVQNLIATPL
jgi:anthranilate 1,2-dioxygenase small subunit